MSDNLYKQGEDLMEDFHHMEKFGHVHRTGVYVFDHCKQCLGPMFGHKAKEAECAKEKYTSDQVLDMEQEIENNMCFEAGLARIDKRSSAKKCNICNEEFENKLNMINHMKATHGTAHGDKSGKMDDAIAQLANAVEQLVKKSTDNDPKKDFDKKTTQLTKAKLPPIWIGQSFDRFNQEVEAWNKSNKDEEYTKYMDLVESLKKNKMVKEYVIETVLDNTVNQEEKTVEKIMELLKDKYDKTTTEKAQDVFKDLLNFGSKQSATSTGIIQLSNEQSIIKP